MPDWIVDYIWSWLSHRRTYVQLPGKPHYKDEEYRIDIGIPQGSLLPSILFPFNAAPLDKERRVSHTSRTL